MHEVKARNVGEECSVCMTNIISVHDYGCNRCNVGICDNCNIQINECPFCRLRTAGKQFYSLIFKGVSQETIHAHSFDIIKMLEYGLFATPTNKKELKSQDIFAKRLIRLRLLQLNSECEKNKDGNFHTSVGIVKVKCTFKSVIVNISNKKFIFSKKKNSTRLLNGVTLRFSASTEGYGHASVSSKDFYILV
jgi:hypothetical protein